MLQRQNQEATLKKTEFYSEIVEWQKFEKLWGRIHPTPPMTLQKLTPPTEG